MEISYKFSKVLKVSEASKKCIYIYIYVWLLYTISRRNDTSLSRVPCFRLSVVGHADFKRCSLLCLPFSS